MTKINPDPRILELLGKDFLGLDVNEVLDHIRGIREDRKITKSPPKRVKASEGKKQRAALNLLRKLTPEQLAALKNLGD